MWLYGWGDFAGSVGSWGLGVEVRFGGACHGLEGDIVVVSILDRRRGVEMGSSRMDMWYAALVLPNRIGMLPLFLRLMGISLCQNDSFFEAKSP